jgi:hypothetical protein
MQTISELFNISGYQDLPQLPAIRIAPLTDIGIMAVVDHQTAQVNSELSLVLRRVA